VKRLVVQNLNQNWKMRENQTGEFLDAKVPGSVYQVYLDHGLMKDPYFRDQETEALKLMEKDYEYVTHFTPDKDIINSPYVVLQFKGLDTIADIWLNGNHLGYADNMHRTWEYEVKSLLLPKDNTIRILFHSPTKYIKEREEKEGYWPIPFEAMKGTSHIRKAQCMFGWDWGPRLPDAGIYRDVYLLGCEAERLDGVYIRQKHEPGKVTLSFKIDLKCMDSRFPLCFGTDKEAIRKRNVKARVTVKNPEGIILATKETEDGDAVPDIEVMNPQLWWPHGLGKQPLYKVMVELLRDGQVIDTFEKRIGLRTLTIRREKDEYGESFAHEVNGITYFAMGADYIPEDCILSRINPERTRNLLEQAVAANYNTIRVWGGGYYPDDFFWDACDELGLVVWLDFMFACGVYRLTSEEFEQNIIEEFKENVKRIRNHACLGLWCGNNEMEVFYCTNRPDFMEEKGYAADYIKLHEYIIPKVLKEYDPDTFYWPSSPSSGGSFDEPDSPDRGDVHYWDVWHGNKPFTEYRKYRFRYLSEFGFQSFPSIRTIESFTYPEDRNIFSWVMEKHQRNAAANGKIMSYMEQTYLYPTSFEALIYASQLLQADAIRYGVEHFRRHRGQCMGTIVWQLNDCWPVASWSSIDYYGRWKALHYFEKRFFAPLLLSCEEEGMLSQDPNPNAEPYELKKSIRLCVSNESPKDETVDVFWELRDNYANILKQGKETVNVKAFSSKWLDKQSFQDADEFSHYVSYHMEKNGKTISGGTVLFTVPKFFHLIDPKLKVRLEGDEIVVSAESYARAVEIRNKEDNLILSDNFFDMNGGERRIKILKGISDELEVRSEYDIR